MPIEPLNIGEESIVNRSFGGIAIDLMRQVLYVTDVNNGQILRIHYAPFIYEEYRPPKAEIRPLTPNIVTPT
jgi:hypothetical protein